jgi:hypothetical protein
MEATMLTLWAMTTTLKEPKEKLPCTQSKLLEVIRKQITWRLIRI